MVNGERNLTLSFLWNDINADFLNEIETGWKAVFQGDEYHLFNEKEDKHGNKQFDAVLDFFDYFNGHWHVDDVENQSMMIEQSIRPLFTGTDYVLNIIDNFYANTMSYSKQQNSTERFIYFIGRHNAEFNIPIGTKTVQIRNRIGVRRNDIIIHEDDNLIDLSIDTDSASFCTAIEYYYDFQPVDEDSNEKEPQQSDVYISPMAEKYGIRYGEPIHDERYSIKENAEEAARLKQEGTWKTSFEVDAEHFRDDAGNVIGLNEGDEIRFIIPSKSINTYIRVVEVNEEFDEDDDLISASYTFGNENISNSYKKMQYDAVMDIDDLLNGKRKLDYNVLPNAVREATNVINNAESNMYYRANEIYGENQNNSLGITRFNSDGIGFSQDGGESYDVAMTYLGIVATAITSGTIDTNRVFIQGTEGHFYINGDVLRAVDYSNPDKYFEISPQGALAHHGFLSVLRPDAYKDSAGKQYGLYMQDGLPSLDSDAQRNQFMHNEVVTWTGQRYQIHGTNATAGQTYNCETVYTSHKSKYIRVGFGIDIIGDFGSDYVLVEFVEFSSGNVEGSIRKFIRAEDGIDWNNIVLDIDVPDYSSAKSYYIRAGLESANNAHTLHFVVNRVSMFG